MAGAGTNGIGRNNHHGGSEGPLRVTFIAGALNKGGAEKQFIYMLRVLLQRGVSVQVLTITQGEYHEQSLGKLGVQARFIGGGSPAVRMARILQEIRAFRPHFVQSTHFFTTLYAGVAGRLCGIPSIGAVRGDLHHDLKGVGRSGQWLLRLPTVLLVNSYNAYENALALGISKERLLVLQNVIDLEDFDNQVSRLSQAGGPSATLLPPDHTRAITVARLIPVKRLERFLQALALARTTAPELQGVIVGAGPEEAMLRQTAVDLGLQPGNPHGGVLFLGERADIPQLLAQSQIAVLTSDREGFPNVLLEAMAASIPIVSTPAGEARSLVEEGSNGYLVPFEDVNALAGRLADMARSPAKRKALGHAGRRVVEQKYSFPRLERDLIEVYRTIAQKLNQKSTLALLEQNLPAGHAVFTPLNDEHKRAKLGES